MNNRIKSGLFIVGVMMAWVSCGQKSIEKEDRVNKILEPVKTEEIKENLSKGFQLLASSCFSCHNPDVNTKNKIAPTMATLKEYYAVKDVTKAEFTDALINFVNNPTEENSKIPQAIEHFGLMPKFNLSKKQLVQIANYIYRTEFENPDWYAKHFLAEKKKHTIILSDISYKELGKHYVMTTKSTLGKNLKGALKTKGTAGAVEFCNERAYQLTDSMADVLHAMIKRVSDKPRNPLNVANESELKYMEHFNEKLKKGEMLTPLIQEFNGKMVGYYPIMTSKMCLQCHGEPKSQIKLATLSKIDALYPKDKAKGYTEDQLRGIWVVEMDKK